MWENALDRAPAWPLREGRLARAVTPPPVVTRRSAAAPPAPWGRLRAAKLRIMRSESGQLNRDANVRTFTPGGCAGRPERGPISPNTCTVLRVLKKAKFYITVRSCYDTSPSREYTQELRSLDVYPVFHRLAGRPSFQL